MKLIEYTCAAFLCVLLSLLSAQAATLLGSPGGDVLIGTPTSDQIYGMGGNDYCDGVGGNDQIDGGLDDDRLYGNEGNDGVHGDSLLDIVFGGIGANTELGVEPNVDGVFTLVLGDDFASGGPGDDAVNGEASSNVSAIVGGFLTSDVESDAELLQALISGGATIEAGDDCLQGDEGADRLAGEASDTIFASSGLRAVVGIENGVTLEASARVLCGNDRLLGGFGDDELFGDAGRYLRAVAGETMLPQSVSANPEAIPSGAALIVCGNDLLFGGFGNDALYGDAGIAAMTTNQVTVFSLNGEADVSLSQTATILLGDDTLVGGPGDDELTGDVPSFSGDVVPGADTFVFCLASASNGHDIVHDFRVADGDILKLEGVPDYNGDAVLTPADLDSALSPHSIVSNAQGEVRIMVDGGNSGWIDLVGIPYPSNETFVNLATNIQVAVSAVCSVELPCDRLLGVEKRDLLINDADSSGTVSPGDTLRYMVGIGNAATDTVSSLEFSDFLNPNLTVVPGSLNLSPLALNDQYTADENAPGGGPFFEGYYILNPGARDLNVTNPAAGLFGNDREFLGDTFVLDSFDAASTHGGTVVVNADGTFSYTGPTNFNGVDTFAYTIRDTRGLADSATVSIKMGNEPLTADGEPIEVMHVNDSGTFGDGSFEHPHGYLLDANYDFFKFERQITYVHGGSVFSNQNYVVAPGQRFLGEGDNNEHLLLTDQLGLIPLPPVNGVGMSRPRIWAGFYGTATYAGSTTEISNFRYADNTSAVQANSVTGTVNINRIEVTGGGGIFVNAIAVGTLGLALYGNDVTADGYALQTTDGGASNAMIVTMSTNTFENTTNIPAVMMSGNGLHSTIVVSMEDNVVRGNGAGGGILFNRISFDSDGIVGNGLQQVSGGNTQIGQNAGGPAGPGDRVQGNGLTFMAPSGDLGFGNLGIANNGGTGLYVDTKSAPGPTVFNLDVVLGTLDTTAGAAQFLDPLSMDAVFDTVMSSDSPAHGIELDQVDGRVRIKQAVVIRPADSAVRVADSAADVACDELQTQGSTAPNIEREGNTGAVDIKLSDEVSE